MLRRLADCAMNGQRMAIVLVEQYCDFAKELADATASLSEVPAS